MTKRFVFLFLVLALVAAACGGDGSSEGVASLEGVTADDPVSATEESPTGVDVEEAMLAFAQCMRDQGLDIEDPTVDADSI